MSAKVSNGVPSRGSSKRSQRKKVVLNVDLNVPATENHDEGTSTCPSRINVVPDTQGVPPQQAPIVVDLIDDDDVLISSPRPFAEAKDKSRRNRRQRIVEVDADLDMAAPAQQEKPSAEVIGQAFAEQYYTVLHRSPAVVYQFYQDNSKLGRPEDGAIMGLTTGMEAINAKIQSYGTLKTEITSIDTQESYKGGVFVLITGHMVKENDKRQSFTQTFFLAPQELGYFVLNDTFRYLEDDHSQREAEDLANGMASLNTSDQETSPVQHNEIVGQPEEANGGEVYDPSEDGEGSVVEQEEPEPVAEVVNEVPTESEEVVEFETKTEEAPKKTYASIVKVLRESGTQIPAPASRKSTPKVQQPQQRENGARLKEQVPPPPPPKEPAFSCPVCMGPLVEEMSTNCGHIFCKACIKLALAKQNKCPTCRKKMTMKDTIRVYLPTAN